MLCPNCGKGRPATTAEDAERGYLEMVTCPACGWKTDAYEATKAAGGQADLDDVERLVAVVEGGVNRAEVVAFGAFAYAGHERNSKRLARIVRELLAFLPREKGCEFYPFYKYGCRDGQPTEPEGFCDPCRVRRLRERCNRLARGEEA